MSSNLAGQVKPLLPGEKSELPFTLQLELNVQDTDTIAELHGKGAVELERYSLSALRIGVLALRQARGQIDSDAVRRESERLLENLDSRLQQHSTTLNDRLTGALKEYFDPQNGRFQERVERLVKRDGELESVLHRQVGGNESELSKTLTSHFGDESPLMKLLSPDQSNGLLLSLRTTVEKQLETQRDQVLKQFSLDNKEGALARFIAELVENQGELSENLRNKIDEVVKEFSLNEEDSAMSKLVRNVKNAQQKITDEFSLDNDRSALARLRGEVFSLLKEDREVNRQFQEDVKLALREMTARREEAAQSPRHGLLFEDAVYELVAAESNKVGDVATRTGNTTGFIKNRKVGDCVIELGPESAAAQAKIVIEAKEDRSYNLSKALEEIEFARKNRDAQVGLFVFSRKTAPDTLEAISRYGHDVVVVWDAEDPNSDLFLKVAISLSRALSVRGHLHQGTQTADFQTIQKAILEIEKRAGNLDRIRKSAESIQNASGKILSEVDNSRKALEVQIELLKDKTQALQAAFHQNESS
ncbi:MAG: hypothetical protein MK165_13170 [Pirellulaceae bacterium]|nr:hypothetical protein [Pirellulaceae bacterium]